MTTHTELVEIDAPTEAGRLWHEAERLLDEAESSLGALCLALDSAARAVELLAIYKLQDGSARFDSTVASLLEAPPPPVNLDRDAIHLPKSLELTGVLDMLSSSELSCCCPQLHHGWEDRGISCRRAREIARSCTGISLGAEARGRLLLLSAYRNRIFRLPPPLHIVPSEILGAIPSLAAVYRELGPVAVSSPL